MKIKDLSKIELPREKLERYGTKKLEEHELLAIMLGSGIKGTNVIQLSKKILKAIGTKVPTLEALTGIKGLGKAKAMQILAALELGDRRHNKPLEVVISPEKVFQLCSDIRDSKKEHFVVFYLSTRNAVIAKEVVSVGTLNESLVHPREIFEPALLHGAARVLLAHNHPSGDPEPSRDDIEVTSRIKEAGRLLGIGLVDHIILTKGRFLSFKDRGVL